MKEETDINHEKFVEIVLKSKEIWLLKADDGLFAMFEDEKNQQYLPVWTSNESATEFISDEWILYKAEAMGIYEFMNWLKELKSDKVLIGLIPENSTQALPVDPVRFQELLSS